METSEQHMNIRHVTACIPVCALSRFEIQNKIISNRGKACLLNKVNIKTTFMSIKGCQNRYYLEEK